VREIVERHLMPKTPPALKYAPSPSRRR
jgi:hypothetical protein